MENNVSLSNYSHIKIGGAAELFCAPRSKNELLEALAYCRDNEVRYKVIGGGANIFFADDGYHGCVICLQDFEKDTIIFHDDTVYVSAGMTNNMFVRKCAGEDLGGIEFLATVPGTIGGALIMNVGCKNSATGKYDEISSFLVSVTAIVEGEERIIDSNDIMFEYRSSSLKDVIIVGAEFKLISKRSHRILNEIQQTMSIRSVTVPWGSNTLGSVFKNPIGSKLSAGQLLDKAGLKGERRGGIVVSNAHANVFENIGTGTAKDMLELIEYAQSRVSQHFGIRLELEIEYIK